MLVATGQLTRGFRIREANLSIFAEGDLFEEEWRPAEAPFGDTRTFLDFRDLKVGDLVVHVDNGIGSFVGLKKFAAGGAGTAEQEFMELRYAGEASCSVPLERLDLSRTLRVRAPARQARRHHVGRPSPS